MTARKPIVIKDGHQQVLPEGETLLTPQPATTNASLNLPEGAAPTSPNDGDVWTTASGMFVQIAGATVGPLSSGGGTPGGSDGQVQFNNAGAFGGFTLSGDATLDTSTGVLTIEPGAVTTGKIADGAVTYAKMQDTSAASVLLGRGAGAGAGVVQEITLGTGLSLTGTTLDAAGTGGTVTSVALALPASVFSVSGSPVTGSGTLTGAFVTQSPNTVFAGDASASVGPAPTFVTSGTYVTFTNVSSVNVAYPASPVAGDYAFIYVESLNNGGVDITSPPAGWTLVAHNGGGLVNQALLMKKLTGSESGSETVNFTATTGANNWGSAFMAYFHGMVGTGTPYEGVATNGNASGTTMTGSAVTTTGANRTVVTFWGAARSSGSGAPTSSTPAGWTNDVADSQGSPVGVAAWEDHIVQASAGTVSAASRTLSVSSWWGAISLALIPAPATPGAPTFRALVSADLPVATTSQLGAVKPDGSTITISGGVISTAGGAGSLPGGSHIATGQSTSSTSYTDLATVGPSVTMTTGTSVLIVVGAAAFQSAGGNTCWMSVAVSGASTVAASDGNAVLSSSPAGGFNFALGGGPIVLTGLTAGSNTFTAKYRVDGSTFTFQNRGLAVFRLN